MIIKIKLPFIACVNDYHYFDDVTEMMESLTEGKKIRHHEITEIEKDDDDEYNFYKAVIYEHSPKTKNRAWSTLNLKKLKRINFFSNF